MLLTSAEEPPISAIMLVPATAAWPAFGTSGARLEGRQDSVTTPRAGAQTAVARPRPLTAFAVRRRGADPLPTAIGRPTQRRVRHRWRHVRLDFW